MTKIQSEVSGFTPRKQLNDSEIKTNSNSIIPLNLITKINKCTNYKTKGHACRKECNYYCALNTSITA